jgi:ankyrin repeat protein
MVEQYLVKAQTDPSFLYPGRNTPLMMAFSNGLPDIALAIIATGNGRIDDVNADGDTALIFACYAESDLFEKVVMEIIATGKGKIGHVDNLGDTALIVACINRRSNLALAIIATGQGNISQINLDGNTALIIACNNGLVDVAMAILATNEGLLNHANNDGETALSCAQDANLTKAIIRMTQVNETSLTIVSPKTLTPEEETELTYLRKLKELHDLREWSNKTMRVRTGTT